MFNCKYKNRTDREATMACLSCEHCLPPGLRKNGNLCGMKNKSNYNKAVYIVLIILLLGLNIFKTWYIGQLEKQIKERDQLIEQIIYRESQIFKKFE